MPLAHHSLPPLSLGWQIPESCPVGPEAQVLGHCSPSKALQAVTGPFAAVNVFHGLIGWGWPPRHQECLWHCSSRWWGFLEAKGCGWLFLQSQCSLDSRTGAGPLGTLQKCPKNTSVSHFPPQVPKSCPESCCRAGLGSPPTSKHFPGCHG